MFTQFSHKSFVFGLCLVVISYFGGVPHQEKTLFAAEEKASLNFLIQKGANEQIESIDMKDGQSILWRFVAAFQNHQNVPENESRKMAGCYIHPLCGINGEVLTDNAPGDHYHHHGIFWTWPNVLVHRPDGTTEKYDTWTSNTRLKQQFIQILETKQDAQSATLRVENGWFIAPQTNQYERDADGKIIAEQIASEVVTITTHQIITINDIQTRAIDFLFEWKIGSCPITLQGAEGKSYGGFSIRFRPSQQSPGGSTRITVPSGVASEDLPDTPLQWANFTSKFQRDRDDKVIGEQSGAAIFVPKTHPDFPPTWLTRYYGPLCVGWPGVHSRKFESGEIIQLSYRVWIHDKPVSLEELTNAYNAYNDNETKK
ncbi:MAG: DUF6807 family protein [Thermoguttaceae bacterium]